LRLLPPGFTVSQLFRSRPSTIDDEVFLVYRVTAEAQPAH